MVSPTLPTLTITANSCHQIEHPNITSLTGTLHLPSSSSTVTPSGTLRAYLFHASNMRQLGRAQMWLECQAFDNVHDGAKLDKIENYLANESFPDHYQAKVDGTEMVVFIEEVWLHPSVRERGLGLWMVDEFLHKLGMEVGGSQKCVVMLQAGAVTRANDGSREDAGEKLTRHWKKLGFSEWSDSDEAWLCLDPAKRSTVSLSAGGDVVVKEASRDGEKQEGTGF